MYQLFSTPAWFNGWDLVFEGIGIIIALLIAGYSWKVYRLSNENKYGYFSLAFILVSLGFVFKLLNHGVLYYSQMQGIASTVLKPILESHVLNDRDLYYRIGFFLQMVFMLGAWLLIFFISQKKRGRLRNYYETSQIGLFVYLVVLISAFSSFEYMVFYLTSAVILSMTVLNYYKNFLNNNKNKNSLLVMNSFLFILIAQFFLVFVFMWEELYVLGEILLLMGFLLLLYTYRRITKR